jgi:hypothetical protein
VGALPDGTPADVESGVIAGVVVGVVDPQAAIGRAIASVRSSRRGRADIGGV